MVGIICLTSSSRKIIHQSGVADIPVKFWLEFML